MIRYEHEPFFADNDNLDLMIDEEFDNLDLDEDFYHAQMMHLPPAVVEKYRA